MVGCSTFAGERCRGGAPLRSPPRHPAGRDQEALSITTADPATGSKSEPRGRILGVATLGGLVLGLLLAVLPPPSELTAALLLSGFCIAAFAVLAAMGARAAGTLAIVAFVLRVAFALFNSHFQWLSDRVAEPLFHAIASQIANGWQVGAPIGFMEISEGVPVAAYSHFVAAIYYLLGPDPMLIYVFNALLDSLAILVFYRIGSMMFGTAAGLACAWIEALSPYTVWMAGTFLRESICRFMLAIFLLQLLRWASGRKSRFWTVLPWLTAVTLLRPENLPILIVVMGTAWLVGLRSDGTPRFSRRRILLGFLLATPVILGILAFVFRYSEVLFRFSGGLSSEFFEAFRQARTHGESAYLEWMRYTSFADLLAYAPLRAVYFMVVPFPWQVNSATQAAAFVGDALVQMGLLAMVFIGRKKFSLAPPHLVAIVATYLIVGAMTYGLVEGNVGAALRHRRQFTFALAILASPQIVAWFTRSRYRSETGDPESSG